MCRTWATCVINLIIAAYANVIPVFPCRELIFGLSQCHQCLRIRLGRRIAAVLVSGQIPAAVHRLDPDIAIRYLFNLQKGCTAFCVDMGVVAHDSRCTQAGLDNPDIGWKHSCIADSRGQHSPPH